MFFGNYLGGFLLYLSCVGLTPCPPQILVSLSVKRGGHTLGAVCCPSGQSRQEANAGPVACVVPSVPQPYRWARAVFT